MIVEFKGGSMDGVVKRIERFFDHIINGNEVYIARAVRYAQLGWVCVWYECQGNYQSEMV